MLDYHHRLPSCTVLAFDLTYASPSEKSEDGHVHNGAFWMGTSTPTYTDGERYTHLTGLGEAEVFRTAGQAVQGELEIPFELFIPLEERHNLPESAGAASVHISFADLAAFLCQSETQQRVSEAAPTPIAPSKGIIWQKKMVGLKKYLLQNLPKRRKTQTQPTKSETTSEKS